MSIWFAAFMGLVQGLTEFLPISSSGHLVIFQNLLGQNIEHNHMLFDVLLHFGTLVSVFVCFWSDIKEMVLEFIRFLRELTRGEFDLNKTPHRRMMIMILIATVPMVIVPFINDFVEGLFSSPLLVGFMLFITAAFLVISDLHRRGKKTAADATWTDALVIGLLQLVAIIPGITRSGTAIMGGSVRGFKRSFAVKFSFLMSIPVIIGANIFTIADAFSEPFDPSLILPYLIGIVVAALSGIGAISLVRFISSRKTYRPFVFYTIGAGLLTIILSLILK
ncbi:MAG: undecaprenyl-diphosphate phosphatase [Ruminococcaceae bacterium]|nr:undecaprenyl-diphosphate phosphatase [Oscillospiraceae bacterium]